MIYFDVIKQFLISIVIFSFIGCGASRLSKSEAIYLAEKYVLENGYTDDKASIDSNNIITHVNILESKAAFYSKGLRQWNVGFRIVGDSTRYKILRIYRNGKKIRMDHQDLQQTQ